MRYKILILTLFSVLYSNYMMAVEGRPSMRRVCLNKLDSTVELLWFKPTDNCNSFTSFSIYGRDNPLNLYSFLYSSTNFSETSTSLKLPNVRDWEFFIVYNKTCNGIDSVFSDTLFIDNTPPLKTEIDSVSVDLATQKCIVGWSQNSSPDTKGYVVYHAVGSNPIIYTTDGTSFFDNDAQRDPAIAPVRYKMAAFDSCDNRSLIGAVHQSMFLQSNYDQCNKKINLSWSNYVGWPVGSYDIFLKINNGNYALVGTVVSNINQFTYNFSKFGDTYCFYIRAHKQGENISSSSNSSCVSTNSIIETKNSYVAKASVQNEEIELTLVAETGTSLEKINIYKSEAGGPYSLFNTLPFTGGVLDLKDADVKVHSKSYKYFFTTEGPCSLVFDTSQVAETILLNVLMLDPGNQLLNWSLYNDFIKGTNKQELLLSNDPSFNKSSPWNILNTLPKSSDNTNDFSTFDENNQQLCYCIRAIENNPDQTYTRRDTSYSNIECVTADPIVYFPNAIQINGYNTSFFPKGIFLDYEKSSFQIFNRWGELIYETDDIRKAWFGTYLDGYVDSDVYAYRARIVGLNGKVLFFDGTITVLK